MSLPTAVFIDTSIFDGQNYNFDSTALASFIPAAKKASLKFLLPDPTAREIKRHIKARSDEALKALEDARRRAPFLVKWDCFPKKQKTPVVNWVVDKIARDEWAAFLKQFDVEKVGYEDVKISTVMDWYDSRQAPFSDKKQKEFPDAFVIAALAAYATKNECHIAVVSCDPDFKNACDRYSSLLYFSSLPSLTEVLLLDTHSIKDFKDVILADTNDFGAQIIKKADKLDVFPPIGYELEGSEINSVHIAEVCIVAIGDCECTVTFEAEIECIAHLRWDVDDADEYSGEYGSVSEDFNISGVAKIALSQDKSKVREIVNLEIDASEIGITAVPY